MNTFLTIVLSVLFTVFLASVAIAGEQSCAPGGLAFNMPSITDSPSDRIVAEVYTGSEMSHSGALAFNEPSITESPSDRIAPEVWTGSNTYLACNEQ